MAALTRKKIDFKLMHDIELGHTVDCSTFMIHEMRQDPNSKWFDWKMHLVGLVRLTILHFFLSSTLLIILYIGLCTEILILSSHW